MTIKGIDYDLHACLENNPQDGYAVEDIAEVLAVWEGENDGDSWRWILRLNDRPDKINFVFLIGGCDYTGWDCQSGASSSFGLTAEKAWWYARETNDEDKNRSDVWDSLKTQLDTHKAQTWREKKDIEIGNPPLIDLGGSK